MAFSFYAGPVAAQSVGRHIENAYKDVAYVWTAPGRVDRDAFTALAAVAAGTGTLMLVDEPVYRWLTNHPNSTLISIFGPFREGTPLSLLGRSFVLVGGSALMYSTGWAVDSRKLREAGMGCISAALSATVARTLFSRVVGRTRPRFEQGAFQFEFFANDWNKRSLPGGHAAHVMSCVSMWNNRFELGAGQPILYAIAGAVGFSRMIDGAHWTSDTFVGQVYGWSIGKGIADRYEGREPERLQPAPPAAPSVIGRSIPGVGIRFSFTF